MNGLSYATNRKILAGCGREVEIFQCQILCFVSVKNFYLRVCACYNFSFLGHDRGKYFLSSTKVSQFQLGVEQRQKFFTSGFWKNFGFLESKKFLTQGVCKIKFLFLEALQGNVFTINHQSFIIIFGGGGSLEIFQCQNLSFVPVKNFYISSTAC